MKPQQSYTQGFGGDRLSRGDWGGKKEGSSGLFKKDGGAEKRHCDRGSHRNGGGLSEVRTTRS